MKNDLWVLKSIFIRKYLKNWSWQKFAEFCLKFCQLLGREEFAKFYQDQFSKNFVIKDGLNNNIKFSKWQFVGFIKTEITDPFSPSVSSLVIWQKKQLSSIWIVAKESTERIDMRKLENLLSKSTTGKHTEKQRTAMRTANCQGTYCIPQQ